MNSEVLAMAYKVNEELQKDKEYYKGILNTSAMLDYTQVLLGCVSRALQQESHVDVYVEKCAISLIVLLTMLIDMYGILDEIKEELL